MNSGEDTSGSTGQEDDREFLRWLRAASLAELRARRVTQARFPCPRWECEALNREIQRRGEP